MADYVSRWTGPNIDLGIDNALNGIGCKKFTEATLDRPLDLNKFHGKISTQSGEVDANGTWVVEYYINGPVLNLTSLNTVNYTPIQIDVYTMDGYTFQSICVDGVYYWRNSPIGQDFTTEWEAIAYPRMENDISDDPSSIHIVDPRVVIYDKLYLIIKLNTDISDGATLKINDENPIQILMGDGEAISSGVKKDSFISVVFNKSKNSFYIIGGNGSKTIEGDVGELDKKKADKASPPITTNVNKPMTKVTVNSQGIVTKVEQATTSDILHNDEDLKTFLDSLESTTENIESESLKYTNDGSVGGDWGTIPTN